MLERCFRGVDGYFLKINGGTLEIDAERPKPLNPKPEFLNPKP